MSAPREARLTDYADPDGLEALCHAISMPDAARRAVLDHAAAGALLPAAEAFPGLFSLETGDAAVKAAASALAPDPDGYKQLAFCLAAARHTRMLYARTGIGDEVYFASVAALSRFTREHRESFGRYGFDRIFWIYRCLSASLFRLGPLEFEMRTAAQKQAVLARYARPGDPLLSVHIPSDAVMSREALDAAYAAARTFFARHFPPYGEAPVYCSTWLLDPALDPILPPSSRLRCFREDYRILEVYPPSDGFLRWVFKRDVPTYADLPEETSLQRGIKALLLSGGGIGGALGVVLRF